MAPTGGGLAIGELELAELEQVRPLWIAFHDYHLTLGSLRESVASPRTAEDSWRVRRQDLREWIEGPDSIVLLARRHGEAVGLAVARTERASGTWEIGERLGLLDILVVSPAERGTGVGRALMEEIKRRMRALGVRMLEIEALAANRAAIDFYERAGAVESTRTYWLPLE
jgi:GNAT superfamily N-acetyltransferase